MKLGKKISGGKYNRSRGKKLCERPGQKKLVKIGEERRKVKRVRGGNKKNILFSAKYVNISGKKEKIQIKNVLETPSNRFLARQNVITKGTIVETELGKVKVTNRPTQDGIVNGVLIE